MTLGEQGDFIEVDLGNNCVVGRDLLRPLSSVRLGGDPEVAGLDGDLLHGSARFRIGRRPIAYDLRKLYKTYQQPAPKWLAMFKQHRLCLVVHRVGAVRQSDDVKIRSLGFQVKFDDDAPLVISDILPKCAL